MKEQELIKAVEGIINNVLDVHTLIQLRNLKKEIATQIVEAIGVDEEKVRTQLVPLPLCFKDAAHMQTWIDNTAHAIANADILTVKGE